MSKVPTPRPEEMITHMCNLHGYRNPTLLKTLHPAYLAQEHRDLHIDENVLTGPVLNHAHLPPVRFAEWLQDALERGFPDMIRPQQLEFICHRIEHTLRKNPHMVKELLGIDPNEIARIDPPVAFAEPPVAGTATKYQRSDNVHPRRHFAIGLSIHGRFRCMCGEDFEFPRELEEHMAGGNS